MKRKAIPNDIIPGEVAGGPHVATVPPCSATSKQNAAAAGRPNVFALLILIGPESQGQGVVCLYGSSSAMFLLLC